MTILRSTRPSRASRAFAIAIACASLVIGIPASAQAPGQGLGGGIDVDFKTLNEAKVGAWADYTMMMPGQTGDGPKVRYALVSKANGKLALEIDTATPKGELDMRLDFTAQGADAWKVAGGKMKMGDQVIDFPTQEISAAPPIKKGDVPGKLVGTEDVTTPAGKFSCKHYTKTMSLTPPGAPPGTQPQSITMELWMSDKVSPTGLVKSSVGPMSMTLAGTGKGAEAKVK